MLSERQLEELLKVFQQRTQAVTNEYLKRMGEHLKAIGGLKPSDVHRLIELKRMNANIEEVKRELARIAAVMIEDVETVFRDVAASDERFAREIFATNHRPTVKYSPIARISSPVERILKAQLRITQQEMANLSQTTIESALYRKAIDKAVQLVQTGMVDYTSAIRSVMKEAATEGLKIVYPPGSRKTTAKGDVVVYPSGYSRRLDTAVRQNVLDGVRSLNQDIMDQVGKEYGADGVEITAHALCAEDHLPYQGRQYSHKEFDRIQNTLRRPFGMWNCKHTMFPILLGISQPAYTEAELQAFARNSREEITIDGVTMTRYEWTQKQRQLETAVRAQKNIANTAKAYGDSAARREAQRNINRLTAEYGKISEVAGLIEKKERMTVAGFRKVKTAKELKNPAKHGIIQVAGRPVNVRMKEQKQREHVWGTAEFNRRTEAAKAANKNLPSAFYQDVDIEALVKKHIGAGVADVNKSGTISEYFDAGHNIGWVYGPASGAYMTTSRVCIRYSKNGWHAFPVLPKE